MRAVDTNVLVRLIVRDDVAQVEAAEAFIERGAWISQLVLAETTWVLAAAYDLDHSRIAVAVEMLLNHTTLTVQDADVAATLRARLEALLAQPPAQGHVLGVAQLGCGELLPAQVVGTRDRGLDHQGGAAGGGARDHPDGLAVRLDEGVDRRVGAHVAGVDRVREERLDRLRPRAEDRGLERHVGSQRLGEDALLDADQGGRVGQVREVAEPKGDRSRRARGRAASSAGRDHGGCQQDNGEPPHCSTTRGDQCSPHSLTSVCTS